MRTQQMSYRRQITETHFRMVKILTNKDITMHVVPRTHFFKIFYLTQSVHKMSTTETDALEFQKNLEEMFFMTVCL